MPTPAARRRTAARTAPPRAGLVPAMVATSFTLFGRTAELRALGAGEALFGADPGALARGLDTRGLALRRARDVVVYRLNEVAAGADPVLRERYLALQRRRDARPRATTTAPETLASIVVVSGGDRQLTRRCLAAIQRYTDAPFEMIVVENGAHDEARRPSRAGDVTTIRNPANEGFAFAVNQGLDCARGRLLAIVHDDVVVGARLDEARARRAGRRSRDRRRRPGEQRVRRRAADAHGQLRRRRRRRGVQPSSGPPSTRASWRSSRASPACA